VHYTVERLWPSLLPRWLYDTMERGLSPAPTRKSTSTDFILVCPLLKSSPAMSDLWWIAASMHPGTNVFWGLPLTNGTPSRMHAMANSVDGDTCVGSNSVRPPSSAVHR